MSSTQTTKHTHQVVYTNADKRALNAAKRALNLARYFGYDPRQIWTGSAHHTAGGVVYPVYIGLLRIGWC